MANYGQQMGSQGYPTGRAPLSLDLATPAAALMQQMIQMKNKEFGLKKGLIDESSRRVLKALDFETIKGLGQETQKKHLERLKEFNDKWSEKYAGAETPGILPDTNLQEMEFDKRAIEQDMASMRANVEEFKEVQTMVLKDLEQYQKTGLSTFDLSQTMENIGNYDQFIGDPSKSPMQMLVARQKPIGEIINVEYGELIDDHSKRFFDRNVKEIKGGYVYFEDGNKKHLSELQGAIMRDIALKGGLESLGQKFPLEQVRDAVQSRVDLTAGTKTTVQQYREPKVDDKGKDYSREIHSLNAFLEGVRQKNTTQLEMLKTKIGADSYSYQDDTNTLIFYDVPSKEGVKPKILSTIKLPEKDASEGEVRQWKIGINSKYPLLKGKEYAQEIEGGYSEEAKLGEVKQPEPASKISLKKTATYTQDEWTKLEDDGQRKRVEKTAKYLKMHFPEGYSVTTNTSGRKRRIIVKDADGNEVIYKMDKKEGGRGYKGRKEFGEFIKSLESKSPVKKGGFEGIPEGGF